MYRSKNFPSVRITEIEESLREYFHDFDDCRIPRREPEHDPNFAPRYREYQARHEQKK